MYFKCCIIYWSKAVRGKCWGFQVFTSFIIQNIYTEVDYLLMNTYNEKPDAIVPVILSPPFSSHFISFPLVLSPTISYLVFSFCLYSIHPSIAFFLFLFPFSFPLPPYVYNSYTSHLFIVFIVQSDHFPERQTDSPVI